MVRLLSSLIPLLGSALAIHPAVLQRSANPAGSLVARAYPDEALRCIQVENPVLLPNSITQDDETIARPAHELPSCKQVVVEHVFGNSYGAPFVGVYSYFRAL